MICQLPQPVLPNVHNYCAIILYISSCITTQSGTVTDHACMLEPTLAATYVRKAIILYHSIEHIHVYSSVYTCREDLDDVSVWGYLSLLQHIQ